MVDGCGIEGRGAQQLYRHHAVNVVADPPLHDDVDVQRYDSDTDVLDCVLAGAGVGATDLDSDDPTSVRLDVGGRSATAVADTPRPDVQAAFRSRQNLRC